MQIEWCSTNGVHVQEPSKEGVDSRAFANVDGEGNERTLRDLLDAIDGILIYLVIRSKIPDEKCITNLRGYLDVGLREHNFTAATVGQEHQ